MQRYAFLFFCLATFSMLGFLACQHDPFLQPIDPNDPDPPVATGFSNPDLVYFQNQMLPILVSNCTESGCHNAQDREEDIVLDSYQSLLSTVENATQNDLQENKLMRALLESDLGDLRPLSRVLPIGCPREGLN